MRCMVLFCGNKDRIPGITYFSLTSKRHDPWMRALGRDPIEKLCRQNSICSEHFLEDDLIVNGKRAFLKPGAVPKLKLGIKRSFPLTSGQSIYKESFSAYKKQYMIWLSAPDPKGIIQLPSMLQINPHEVQKWSPIKNDEICKILNPLNQKKSVCRMKNLCKLEDNYRLQPVNHDHTYSKYIPSPCCKSSVPLDELTFNFDIKKEFDSGELHNLRYVQGERTMKNSEITPKSKIDDVDSCSEHDIQNESITNFGDVFSNNIKQEFDHTEFHFSDSLPSCIKEEIIDIEYHSPSSV